ncbi:DHA2 family efflux MFS transporter permease subunit [soil metagenome]
MIKRIDQRWIAFTLLCLATLMEVLDSTIVNVALPSIRADLHFSAASLAWVVNAYLLTFGGFLLLGGRLGDIFGQKKLFLIGIAIFTLSSLGCGLAQTPMQLLIARAILGLGAAIDAAVSLALIMNLFSKPKERTRAMGYFGFIAAGGGSLGVLLGGLLTNSFDWHWNFLINIPIGIVVFLLSWKLLPDTHVPPKQKELDIGGAISITASLLLAVYAIVNGQVAGWTSPQTLGLLTLAALLLGVFVWIESRVRVPLIPLSLFQMKNVVVANSIGVLWAASMFAWFFLAALYLQLVLHYNPLQVGLSFLPANLIMAVFSISISARLVTKFGIKKPLAIGLFLAGIGLALFVRAPVNGNFMTDVLPSMILLGIGAGAAFNPVFLAAMSDVKESDSGLASGLVNTSFMMGGALGLAILVSIATARTTSLLSTGTLPLEALNSGYHVAFLVSGFCSMLAAIIGWIFLTEPASIPEHTT